MNIKLPALPYTLDALEPHISARTVEIHYTKHHQGYVNKVNKALEASDSSAELDELVINETGSLYNNAAQVWNHTFYWYSLSPNGGGRPDGELLDAINETFGSFESAKEKLVEAAADEFGSGWAWLVHDGSNLEILSTTDAVNPVREGKIPLLTIDVWEHAYYLDRQNERGKYIEAVVEHLLNWEFAEQNFQKVLEAKNSS
ncbi:MAG: superoxide dismutase [bacterium]